MQPQAFYPPPPGVTVVSTPFLPGHKIVNTIGFTWGLVVRSRGLGGNIMAGLRTIPGGEITEHTEMLDHARYDALMRLMEHARSLGANAVISMRFDSSGLSSSMSEIVAYGTAVVVAPDATAEDGAKLIGEAPRRLLQRHGPPQQPLHRGDAAAGDAAGDDAPEPLQVHADVERQAVAGHPAAARPSLRAADPHADGGDLLACHPDAGEPRLPPALDPVAAQGAEDDLLEAAHVVDDAQAGGAQVDDGIGHELAGAVEGDVAATVDFQQGGAQRPGIARGLH